jgi:hypothetical protein
MSTMFAAIAALLPMFFHPATTFWHDFSLGVCGTLAVASICIGVSYRIHADRQRRAANR